jgi:hypothetical protein
MPLERARNASLIQYSTVHLDGGAVLQKKPELFPLVIISRALQDIALCYIFFVAIAI